MITYQYTFGFALHLFSMDNGSLPCCVTEVVNKLISKGERLVAVKFIFHFELTEKIPPLPLLEAYISEFEEFTQKVDRKGKNSRQAVVSFCAYLVVFGQLLYSLKLGYLL